MAPPTAPADGLVVCTSESPSPVNGDISNPSASVSAGDEDGKADHGATVLAAHVELSRKLRMSLHVCPFKSRTH